MPQLQEDKAYFIYLGNRLRHNHPFKISANTGYFDWTEQALLMNPKGQNASRDGLVKLIGGICCLNCK